VNGKAHSLVHPKYKAEEAPPKRFAIGTNFTGLIDEVRIWNKFPARNETCPHQYADQLILHFSFDECEGGITTDLSSSGACARVGPTLACKNHNGKYHGDNHNNKYDKHHNRHYNRRNNDHDEYDGQRKNGYNGQRPEGHGNDGATNDDEKHSQEEQGKDHDNDDDDNDEKYDEKHNHGYHKQHPEGQNKGQEHYDGDDKYNHEGQSKDHYNGAEDNKYHHGEEKWWKSSHKHPVPFGLAGPNNNNVNDSDKTSHYHRRRHLHGSDYVPAISYGAPAPVLLGSQMCASFKNQLPNVTAQCPYHSHKKHHNWGHHKHGNNDHDDNDHDDSEHGGRHGGKARKHGSEGSGIGFNFLWLAGVLVGVCCCARCCRAMRQRRNANKSFNSLHPNPSINADAYPGNFYYPVSPEELQQPLLFDGTQLYNPQHQEQQTPIHAHPFAADPMMGYVYYMPQVQMPPILKGEGEPEVPSN